MPSATRVHKESTTALVWGYSWLTAFSNHHCIQILCFKPITDIHEAHAVPACGKFHDGMKLNATFLRDVSASTEGECLEKCYANAQCEGVSFKKTGGCWLRKDVKGFMPDATKSSYVLCEGERGAPHAPVLGLQEPGKNVVMLAVNYGP